MVKGFKCIMCGECCRTLYASKSYHPTDRLSLSTEDIDRWSDRSDIKAWVKDNKIWYDPETGKATNSCPWLKGNECSIHDVKPDTCRGYPANLRIAIKSGCNGITK